MNAADNAEGQLAFDQLSLPGHPSIIIYDTVGNEIYRGFGSFVEETLVRELENLIER